LYQCDGCGKQLKSHEELRNAQLPFMRKYDSGFAEDESGYFKEFCVHCWLKILETIKGLEVKNDLTKNDLTKIAEKQLPEF
jgi:hypothetical protein